MLSPRLSLASYRSFFLCFLLSHVLITPSLLLLPGAVAQDTTDSSTDSATDTSAPATATSVDPAATPVDSVSPTASTVSATDAASTFSSAATPSSSVTPASNSTVPASNSTSSASNSTTPISNATASCQCGFFDPLTSKIYTDSIIIYFNETNTSVPTSIFSIDTFANPYEKGWQTFYREGAIAENVAFEQGTQWNLAPSWLDLNVSGQTPDHLSNGAQLQTVRQDIMYGSFRGLLRPANAYTGGSALSMKVQYNETISAELDLLNEADSHDDACMMPITNGLDPITNFAANNISFNTLQGPNYNIWAWGFFVNRFDWDANDLTWYVGPGYNKTFTNSTANASMVGMPTAFYLKHWSNGNMNWMKGPPGNNTAASVGWLRLFFNSSVQSTSQINSSSCSATQMCNTEDYTLRVTTNFTQASTVRLDMSLVAVDTQDSNTVGLALIIASLCFSAVLIAHALIRKSLDKKDALRPATAGSRSPSSGFRGSDNSSKGASSAWTSQAEFEMDHLKSPNPADSVSGFISEKSEKGRSPYQQLRRNPSISERPLLNPSRPVSTATLHLAADPNSREHLAAGARTPDSIEPVRMRYMDASTADLISRPNTARSAVVPEGSAAAANPGAKPTPAPGALPQATKRLDYLAGLVAVCSLLVSCQHFILTYVPSVVLEFLPRHYDSELWARKTIEPFVFNEIWVGIFFTTSTRFLTTGYLRNGNLKTIAEKIVCRCPRLMIPITAVILFEYFVMDLGATKYLEYVPSVSWSNWPMTSVYPNFGWFVDEVLQLFYLIPNAVPNITWNFCTGVLWTIPVQLQNSWLVLIGVVIIREIKNPWKRFGYYGFCIVNHWYAMSWGSYFWFGLMLADLDITYKYRTYIQARPLIHYPMLILASVLVFFSLANDLFSYYTGYTFGVNERGIHPDPETLLPIAQTALAGYPLYTEPKLNGLVFAVASQYIVELSTWVQAVLSTRVFLWLFPHVFTIYLIHGLVWWSLGSVLCIYFAGLGYAYWLNMLLTATICYVSLFLSLPIVTPVIEMLGKEITKGIWIGASEEPAPWRPSSFPLAIEDIYELVHRRDDEDHVR